MKPFLDVEKNRKAYHALPFENTVHRSSLIVPKIENTQTIISFLNHFLLKRGNLDVVIKISAIDKNGSRLSSKTFDVNEKKVYQYNLDNLFADYDFNNFIIEFFSSKNLFIPFPAVMINHLGKDFCNVVHSYNRILNDIFEDDAVNKIQVSEASFDVLVNDDFDTFINISSGINDLNDSIYFSYESDKITINKKINLELPRLSHKTFYLSDLIDGYTEKGTIKVTQPKQNLFFGRILAGIQNKKTRSFSANHSYYDSSKTKEYFTNDTSYRVYPFFSDQINKISMYPIMSESNLEIELKIYMKNNRQITDIYNLKSPSAKPLHININQIAEKNNLELIDIDTFSIFAKNKDGNAPTRINHQLIYGSKLVNNPLSSSINVSLMNDDVFKAKNKTSHIWGQLLSSDSYESKLGLNFINPDGNSSDVELEFYNSSGLINKFKKKLYPKKTLTIKSSDIIPKNDNVDFIWYIAKSKRSDLSAFFSHTNIFSGNSSGDHTF